MKKRLLVLASVFFTTFISTARILLSLCKGPSYGMKYLNLYEVLFAMFWGISVPLYSIYNQNLELFHILIMFPFTIFPSEFISLPN